MSADRFKLPPFVLELDRHAAEISHVSVFDGDTLIQAGRQFNGTDESHLPIGAEGQYLIMLEESSIQGGFEYLRLNESPPSRMSNTIMAGGWWPRAIRGLDRTTTPAFGTHEQGFTRNGRAQVELHTHCDRGKLLEVRCTTLYCEYHIPARSYHVVCGLLEPKYCRAHATL